MELSEFYPSPSELIKSELDVLDHLRTNPYIKEVHSVFARHASKYYDRNGAGHASGFEFVSYLDVCHAAMHGLALERSRRGRTSPNVRLLLAVRIKLEKRAFSDVTYCLAV